VKVRAADFSRVQQRFRRKLFFSHLTSAAHLSIPFPSLSRIQDRLCITKTYIHNGDKEDWHTIHPHPSSHGHCHSIETSSGLESQDDEGHQPSRWPPIVRPMETHQHRGHLLCHTSARSTHHSARPRKRQRIGGPRCDDHSKAGRCYWSRSKREKTPGRFA
jgi:hypothetical protein